MGSSRLRVDEVIHASPHSPSVWATRANERLGIDAGWLALLEAVQLGAWSVAHQINHPIRLCGLGFDLSICMWPGLVYRFNTT